MNENGLLHKLKEHIMVKDVIIVLGTVIIIVGWLYMSRPPSEEFVNGHQELLVMKENITGDFLSKCNFEVHKCSFNPEDADMNELAGYIRNARPVYATGHEIPYAFIRFIENKYENYFKMNILFYNLYSVKGVAILECEIYKNGKSVAKKNFSSPELTDWAIRCFPEIFDKIQKENEKKFYMDIKE